MAYILPKERKLCTQSEHNPRKSLISRQTLRAPLIPSTPDGTMLEDATGRLSEFFDKSKDYAREHPYVVAGLGVGALLGTLLLSGSSVSYTTKPGTGALSGGSIERGKVKDVYDDYHEAYGKGAGEGITDRNRTTGKFYTVDWAHVYFLYPLISIRLSGPQTPAFTSLYGSLNVTTARIAPALHKQWIVLID